jgi:hypothetical protein
LTQEPTVESPAKRGGVQDRRRLVGATSFVTALADKSVAPSIVPVIEPDMAVSVIWVSDGFHGRHSRLHRRSGDRQQAKEHLTTATTLYREMDMGFWLEQADAEMKALAERD